MVLKKRFSYRWKLFIPLLGMLWTLAAVVIVYQYMHEVESRGEIIRKQVDLISKRILDAYTHNTDLRQYMNFVNNHFTKELLDDASLCVYDTQTGRLEYYAGLPVIQDFSDAAVRPEIEDAVKFGKGEVVTKDQDGTIFFYKALKSEDGKIIVHTSVPYTVQVIDALKSNSNFYWILLFIVLTATIIAYYSTRLLSKNISILRDFAITPPTEKLNTTQANSLTMNSVTSHARLSNFTPKRARR